MLKKLSQNLTALLVILVGLLGLLGLTWASNITAGQGDIRPMVSSPSPMASSTPSPELGPESIPYGELPERTVNYTRRVFSIALEYIRDGRVEDAAEVIRSHAAAQTKGCQWRLSGAIYRADDARAKVGVYTTMRDLAQIAMKYASLYLQRDVPVEPVIEHEYVNGRVKHVIIAQRALIAIIVRCYED